MLLSLSAWVSAAPVGNPVISMLLSRPLAMMDNNHGDILLSIRGVTQGRWPEILPKCGFDAPLLNGKHGPCPICDGKGCFRFDNKGGRGTYLCGQCGSGDGFDLLEKVFACSFLDAVDMIEKSLGTDSRSASFKERLEAYRRKLVVESKSAAQCGGPA